MRKSALALAISETVEALRAEVGAREAREFLIMLAWQQHEVARADLDEEG